MFGRLGLSTEEAKLQCSNIAKYVFSRKKLYGVGCYKTSRLEAAIKRMLAECGENEDARMLDSKANLPDACKAVVCVASGYAMRAKNPVCLRTYSFEKNSVPDCTIVEALCAAFAVPELFKPAIILETGEIPVSYVGLVDYNPTSLLLGELSSALPGGRVKCITSIGTGQEKATAMDCERTAEELFSRFQNTPGTYFRFGIDRDARDIRIDDWTKQPVAVVGARAALRMTENDTKMVECVGGAILGQSASNQNIANYSPVSRTFPPSIAGVNFAQPSIGHTITNCPPPSGLFTGRIAELEKLEACLVDGSKERRVFVLYGLGGAGKTQLALRFAEMHKDRYRYIFYIDATSTTTIETDLKSIALEKKAGDNPSDALNWLAQQSEQWLVVYNNADDINLDLGRFFPTCSHGRILVTTRNRRIITLARGPDPHLQISAMLVEDAQELLVKAIGSSDGLSGAGGDLAKELGYFALAITHAGAYIRTHCCTALDYLDMYRASRGRILDEYANHVPKIDNYELTVYATWRVSYECLEPLDRQLYNTMVFMHHDHISEDIFRFAALGLQQHKSALAVSGEEISRKQTVSEMLRKFQVDDGQWDKLAFLRSIDGLQAYSLVTFDSTSKSYSIHPLVHQWTRTEVQDSHVIQSCAALLLASCVTQNHKSDDYAFRRMLLNHIEALPEEEKTRPHLVGRIKLVYYEAGRYKEAGLLVEKELQAKTRQLGEQHLSTLTCKAWKASVFSKQGQWREAEILQKEVLDVIKRVGGEEHPYSITSLANLADIYRNQGRWAEAEKLGRKAVEISKRVLGNEHSNTTTRMGNLACTLWKQGKWQEAEALDREVIEIKKRLKGSDHPDTSTSMANLATTLWSQGHWQEAEALHREVLELSQRLSILTLSYHDVISDHPYTLKCMHNLASAYWSQKKYEQAEELLQEAVEVGEKTQGPEHPQTLKSKANLAEIYRHQKRWEEAEKLERKVVEVRTQTLGNRHPDTLKSLANLALTCRGLGRLSEAEELMVSAVDDSKVVFGASHRYTKNRARWLAEIRQARS
ncbi:hypothetical protein FRC07_000040 [Ceratobasidium sp. 392]|nr:hypothetical protein FRC07_000040 [Ceratobasidium sp. 392]